MDDKTYPRNFPPPSAQPGGGGFGGSRFPQFPPAPPRPTHQPDLGTGREPALPLNFGQSSASSIGPQTPSGQDSSQARGASASASASASGHDELIRLFNTAMVATRAEEMRETSSELYRLMESAAFRAILNAVRQFARLQNIPERQAAEQIIQTFRKVDRIWSDFVFQEGVDRLKSQSPGS